MLMPHATKPLSSAGGLASTIGKPIVTIVKPTLVGLLRRHVMCEAQELKYAFWLFQLEVVSSHTCLQVGKAEGSCAPQ